MGQAALDAVMAAGNARYFPEQSRDGLESHRVEEVYLFGTGNPDLWVDISDTFGCKLEAIAQHVSQIADVTEIEDQIGGWNRSQGESKGFAYAEAFKVLHGLFGFGSEMDIIKGMEMAVQQGARVLSMSLGGDSCQGGCLNCPECRTVRALAVPAEVLLVAETAGIKEVSLAGDWWPKAGSRGGARRSPLASLNPGCPSGRPYSWAGCPARAASPSPEHGQRHGCPSLTPSE